MISKGVAFQALIHMAETREMAFVACGFGRSTLAAIIEVRAREHVGAGNYRSAHRPVFVGALRPRNFAIQPQVEAHPVHFAMQAQLRAWTASSRSSGRNGFFRTRQERNPAMSEGSGEVAT